MKKHLTNYLDRHKKRKSLDKQKILEALKMILGKREEHFKTPDGREGNRSE